MKDFLKLCLVTHSESKPLSQYIHFILEAVRGGVTLVQLREKNKIYHDLRTMAFTLKTALAPLMVPLIINDNVTLAAEINADGVHLGQKDLSPEKAREILGPDKIIGLSIENFAQLKIANSLTCIDYVAASAVFPSQTKSNCTTIWGLDGLKKFTISSHHPVIGIGGITVHNIKKVIKQGAKGAAIIGALHEASHPFNAAHHLITQVNQALEEYHVSKN